MRAWRSLPVWSRFRLPAYNRLTGGLSAARGLASPPLAIEHHRMQPIKRFFEWYLGIPPAQPGQGTAWSIQHDAPWPAWVPAWGLLGIAVVAAVWGAWIYSRDAAGVPLHRRG